MNEPRSVDKSLLSVSSNATARATPRAANATPGDHLTKVQNRSIISAHDRPSTHALSGILLAVPTLGLAYIGTQNHGHHAQEDTRERPKPHAA